MKELIIGQYNHPYSFVYTHVNLDSSIFFFVERQQNDLMSQCKYYEICFPLENTEQAYASLYGARHGNQYAHAHA